MITQNDRSKISLFYLVSVAEQAGLSNMVANQEDSFSHNETNMVFTLLIS